MEKLRVASSPLDLKIVAAIDKLAAAERRTRAAMVALLLEEALDARAGAGQYPPEGWHAHGPGSIGENGRCPCETEETT